MAHHLIEQRGFINATTKQRGVQDVSPMPLDKLRLRAVDLTHRFQWVSPLMLSPLIRIALHAGSLFSNQPMTTKLDTKSAAISLGNDKSKQHQAASADTTLLRRITDTVFALAESPVNKGTLWAATDEARSCYD